MLEIEPFWRLNCVLLLNWIVWNRTVSMHKMDLVLNNLQWLIYCKTKPNQLSGYSLTELFRIGNWGSKCDWGKKRIFLVIVWTVFFLFFFTVYVRIYDYIIAMIVINFQETLAFFFFFENWINSYGLSLVNF